MWKLPGGAIDRCENIHEAAVRETKEETGLDSEFLGILNFRHFHPFRFGNTSDIYFICLLKYDGDCSQFDRDENEIAAIQWMDIDEVLQQKGVQGALGTAGCRANVTRKVDALVKHWNDDEMDLGLLSPSRTKPDREYFVFGPKI